MSGKTRQEVRAKLKELYANLDAGVQAPGTYTVQAAVDDWLAEGLSGRSARTLALHQAGVKPLTDKLGARALRWDHLDLDAGTVAVWRSDRRPGRGLGPWELLHTFVSIIRQAAC
ncbi:MAG: hypothetical protein ACRDOH_35380 [Streptosporangiaceae bacterium]